jgi:hypothetical protein
VSALTDLSNNGDDVRLQCLCFVRCDHDDDALLDY